MGGDNFKATKDPPTWVKLNPLAWFGWSLDFASWALPIVPPLQYVAKTISQSGRQMSMETSPGTRRHPKSGEKLVDNLNGMNTAFEVFQKAWDEFADKPALGTRKYLGEYQGEKDRFPLKKFGETEWLTYGQCKQKSLNFGAGLRKLGNLPIPEGADYEQLTGPHTLLIYEETCAQWLLSAHGAMSQSIAVATSYATLGVDSVANAIQETNAAVLVCNYNSVKKMLAMKAQCPTLKTIIYTRHYVVDDAPPLQSTDPSVQVLSFDEVVELGAQNPVPVTPPTPSTLGLLMYTSGSTGKPKGVMITQRSLVSAIASMYQHIDETAWVERGKECYLAYLPAAHILEFSAESTFFSLGGTFGFCCPRTISSKGAVRECPDGTINRKPGFPYPPGGIQEFRPTFMAAVPKIWDILKKGVEDTINQAGTVKQFAFHTAFSGRANAVAQGRDSPLWKKVIFNKVKDMMGGRLKGAISGGGAISSEVQTFIRTVMCIPLVQGYGLTETSSCGTIQERDDPRDGVVGKPLAGLEIKLESTPDVKDGAGLPYKNTDVSHLGAPCKGRGEVCIRGPVVSSGYYKQPDKTAEAYDSDGWFHTGDIGLWTTDGCLQLVDRLKNLIKLKGGEYIAIEQMESIYTTCRYVNGQTGGIMCYGTGDMDRPVALVQVDGPKIKEFAKSTGISDKSVEELCEDPAVVKEVLKSLHECHKGGGLSPIEKLCAVTLVAGNMSDDQGVMWDAPGSKFALSRHSAWVPGAGLTASNKLDRKPIVAALEASCITPLMKEAAK
mmetsp:Transcript_23840/g.28795  ORF Transcript_23840/g.28795 Transcript_23840/m.28795 type:complete len:779 (-) Transcript_23840:454-2790(-)|eukprot:CAMPEP_0197848994 /NCGR_PEP_ID=MMETSP1438-20131217/10582_1 /TAXON_ID=1461541 /ORGANISM="Pterosperma sp., Strain CCMP1384" /LENGTH=778 /DNA_ID=CAMNT_0043461485 /DNA_START=84 /DNA_END=2420 /DNA_ORIENTATION=+